jgi:aminopeptidase N
MRLTISATAALLLAGCAAAAFAQPAASSTTEGPLPQSITSSLPRNARPLHYRIDVHPDAAKLTFTGTESVTLRVY